MAVLEILEAPHPLLSQRARDVREDEFGPALAAHLSDMAETMYAAPGIGLAATQVNIHERVVVIDISETHDELRVFINPEIVAQSGREESEEGCLSVPGIFDKVERAERVTVRALDRDGKRFELEAEGLLAVCVQHEMDHLMGKVFVDYLSNLKRNRIKAKLAKQAREHRPDAAPVRASL